MRNPLAASKTLPQIQRMHTQSVARAARSPTLITIRPRSPVDSEIVDPLPRPRAPSTPAAAFPNTEQNSVSMPRSALVFFAAATALAPDATPRVGQVSPRGAAAASFPTPEIAAAALTSGAAAAASSSASEAAPRRRTPWRPGLPGRRGDGVAFFTLQWTAHAARLRTGAGALPEGGVPRPFRKQGG